MSRGVFKLECLSQTSPSSWV